MRLRYPVRRICAALMALFLVSCSSDDPAGPTPSISLSLSQSALSIQQGANGSVTATVTRTGDFGGAVTLSVQGLPSAVTAPNATIAANETSATLTLSAAAAAAVGTTALTVQASGTGVDAVTAALSLSVTAAPTGSFTLTPSASAVSVEQGADTSVTVAIARTAPFSGAVGLAVSGLPAGVTAAINPTSATGASAEVTFTATAGAAPGTSTVTITGTGTGVSDATATVALTVTAPAGTGGFTLSLSSGALSVQQGASGNATLTVTRQAPFTGDVDLAITGAPAGVTATATPASVVAGTTTSTISVSTTGAAAVGLTTLTITGSSAGVADATATLDLTVTSMPSGSAFSWTFCPTVPTWFAVQDGSGAWTQITPTGNRFDFSVSSGTAGIAYVTTSGGESDLVMNFLATSEIMQAGADLCPGTRSAGGSVTGASSGTTFISLGGAAAVLPAGIGGGAYTVEGIRDGVVDLLAASNSLTVAGMGASAALERIYLERGLNPLDGANDVDIDFNGANSFAPGSATVTTTGAAGASTIMTMIYRTAGTSGVLFQELGFTAGTSRSFPTVPAPQQQSGDLHGLTLTTEADGTGGIFGNVRSASIFFEAPTDRQVDFGPVLGATDITVPTTAPYAMPRVQYMQQAEYGKYFFANYQQSGGATVQAYLTDGYVGGSAIDFTVPDFSAVAGWSNAWGLQTGVNTTYSFVSSGWTGDGAIAPETVAAGLTIATATRIGEITP